MYFFIVYLMYRDEGREIPFIDSIHYFLSDAAARCKELTEKFPEQVYNIEYLKAGSTSKKYSEGQFTGV